MSFTIHEDTIKTNIFIPKKDFLKAFKTAKAYVLKQDEYIRVVRTEVENSKNLSEFIDAMRWEMKTNFNGDMDSIYHHGINVSDELLLFESLAPFVQNNSFLEYQREGESGQQKERYDFLSGKVTRSRWIQKYDMEDKEYWEEL